MNDSIDSRVTSKDGRQGRILPERNPDYPDQVGVILDDGQEVWAPESLLQEQDDGSYYLPVSVSDLDEAISTLSQGSEEVVLPVIEEKPVIRKNPVTTGVVRLTKHVSEREEVVDEPIYNERVDVERVPINRQIDQPVEARYEGDTLVIPVMEEVLVVEKRIMLKEEVRITRLREQKHNPQPVTLRQEEITVERIPQNRVVDNEELKGEQGWEK